MKQAMPAAGLKKGVCRAALAAAMVALMPAAAGPAAAQDEEQPRWFGSSFDDKTVLAYGIPDSDYVVLAFACQPGARVVRVSVQDEESHAEEGDLLLVRLAAGGERVAFSDRAALNRDSGGVELYADLPLNDSLRHLLTAAGPLEITVEGRTQRYAMDGAIAPATRMIAACDSPKPTDGLEAAPRVRRP